MNGKPPTPRQGPKSRGKRHATVACTSCKQKRSKCDEGCPCSNCVRRNVECVYEQSLDGRRKEYRKQAVEELQVKVDELETLLELIRTGETNTVLLLVHSLRRGSRVSEILQHIHLVARTRDEDAITSKTENLKVIASPTDHTEQFENAIQHHARRDKAENASRQRRKSIQSSSVHFLATDVTYREGEEEKQSILQSSDGSPDHSVSNTLQLVASTSTLSSDADLFTFFEAPRKTAPYPLHHHHYLPGLFQPLEPTTL